MQYLQDIYQEGPPVVLGTSDEHIVAGPLMERIKKAAAGKGTITFVGSAAAGAQKGYQTITWAKLNEEARAMAAILQQAGVKAGNHIALLGPTTRSLVTAIQAVWLAGASISVLPIPMRFGSVEEFARQTRDLMRYGDIDLLLLDSALAAFYEAQPGDPKIMLLDELAPGPGRPVASDYIDVPYDPQRLAILQFTSGSTAAPKGVMLPHRILEANISGMIAAAEISAEDVFVSWLPLYHDMGLVGLLIVPMVSGCSLVLAAPQDFLSRPADWLHWLHDFKGTVTSGPNFSWVLATRAFNRLSETGQYLNLSRIRIALNGAEPIDPQVIESLIEASKAHGFRPEAVFCAFGMAELSLGGTFPPPLRGVIVDAVNRKKLEEERIAVPLSPGAEGSRSFPLLGVPIPGLKMRICDLTDDSLRGLRQVGELEISGTSVTAGYYKREDLNEELFHDGWLKTGDLAYFVEGPGLNAPELILCGRIKDVIIVAGRNIFPEDIERAVGKVEGIRAGNVIACGLEGSKRKETIIVVAEARTGDYFETRRLVRNKVIDVVGFPPRDIVLVEPGTLPKTSSGKLQRSLCRKQYQEKQLKALDAEFYSS